MPKYHGTTHWTHRAYSCKHVRDIQKKKVMGAGKDKGEKKSYVAFQEQSSIHLWDPLKRKAWKGIPLDLDVPPLVVGVGIDGLRVVACLVDVDATDHLDVVGGGGVVARVDVAYVVRESPQLPLWSLLIEQKALES